MGHRVAQATRSACATFAIQISNSQALASSRRRASWAFSCSPLFEGRRNAERRALVLSAAAYFPDCRETEATETPLSVPPRRLLRPWDLLPGTGARSSPSRQVSPPFTCPVQPLKAAPRSGPGRLPKASRCHACEAQPQAPHPTGLGYPSPAKLSLCPTSVTPLEAPLIGQDTSRISEVLGTGITIHDFENDLMLMNDKNSTVILSARRAAASLEGSGHKRDAAKLCPRPSFETRARARSSG